MRYFFNDSAPLLLQVLNLNQTTLQGLILLNELVDPVVSNLIFLLVKCARDKDTTVSGLAAKCLGCIGAIDPGTLNPRFTEGIQIKEMYCLRSMTEVGRGREKHYVGGCEICHTNFPSTCFNKHVY